jgi:hypothetical protein
MGGTLGRRNLMTFNLWSHWGSKFVSLVGVLAALVIIQVTKEP